MKSKLFNNFILAYWQLKIQLFITKHAGTGANGNIIKGNKEKDRCNFCTRTY
jgi:hypothetical protein